MMERQRMHLSGEDLARPAEDLPLKAIRNISYKLLRTLSNSGNWETIAEELGYDWEEIKQFQAMAAVQQEVTPGELMLQDWRQKGSGRTLYVLHDALRAADRLDCVELLEKEIYEKLVCIDLRVCIKHENSKLVEHKKVQTRTEATVLDSLQHLLEQPIRDNYRLLDHSATWTQTLAREFKGRELMILKCANISQMEQDPTVDSSSSRPFSTRQLSPTDRQNNLNSIDNYPRTSQQFRFMGNQSVRPVCSVTQEEVSVGRGSRIPVNMSSSPDFIRGHSDQQYFSNLNNLNQPEQVVGTRADSNKMNIPFYSTPRQNELTSTKQSAGGIYLSKVKSQQTGTKDSNTKHTMQRTGQHLMKDFVNTSEGDYGRSSAAVFTGHAQNTAGFRHQIDHGDLDEDSEYRSPDGNYEYRDPGANCVYRDPTEEDCEYRDPTGHSEYRDPTGNSEYRDPAQNSEYRDPTENSEYRDPTENSEYRDQTGNSEYRDPAQNNEYRDPAQNNEYRDPAQNSEYRDPSQSSEYRDPAQNSEYRDPDNSAGYRDSESHPMCPDTVTRAHRSTGVFTGSAVCGVETDVGADIEESCCYEDPALYRDPSEVGSTGNSNRFIFSNSSNRQREEMIERDHTIAEYQLAVQVEPTEPYSDDDDDTTLLKQPFTSDLSQMTFVKAPFSLGTTSATSSYQSTESSDLELVVSKHDFNMATVEKEVIDNDTGAEGADGVEPMETDDVGEERYYLDFNKYPQDTEETFPTLPFLPNEDGLARSEMESLNHTSSSTVLTKSNIDRSEAFKRSQSATVDVTRHKHTTLKWSQSTVTECVEVDSKQEDYGSQQASKGNDYESLNRQQSCPAYMTFSRSDGMGLSQGITIADVFSPTTEEIDMRDFELEARRASLGTTTRHVSFDSEVISRVPGPSRCNSLDLEVRSASMRERNQQPDASARQRFFKQRNSLPTITTIAERPPLLRQSTTVSNPPHPFKMVVAGKTSRPSLDKHLVGDNIFVHYNKVLHGYLGWSPRETENTVLKTMTDTLKDNGYFVLWYWRGKSQLIISVSYRGKLENFRVFTKVMKDAGLVFYIYKEEKFRSVIELLNHYSVHGLLLSPSSGSRSQQGQGYDEGVTLDMRCPVVVQYEKTPALSV